MHYRDFHMILSVVCYWFNFLGFTPRRKKIETLASYIAQQCKIDLIRRSSSKTLSHGQMRGYVRAYITSNMESSIIKHLKTETFSSSQITEIIGQVKELLIEKFVSEIQPMSPKVREDIAFAA